MPGSNYTGSAFTNLEQLLNQPMPGRDSAGFDALSGGYQAGEQTGMADIARRGLTQSGATPELFTDLGEQYAKGAGAVVSAGQQQQNQRLMQILNAMLGLGQAQEGQVQADVGQQEQNLGTAGGIFTGLFGSQPGSLLTGPGSTGLLSSGIWGNPNFFSQVTGILGP